MSKIFVTKTFLPPEKEYQEYVSGIFQRCQLTNQGPLLKELEARLSEYLGVKHFHYITNGTVALQLALRVLGIDGGEVITTPFSYVATTSAILWEHCVPVFVDIDRETLALDPARIEEAITPRTRAIMPVHVFGYPCDVDAIQEIADKHHLKVIYDAAHAFGVRYRGQSLLNYGDISTLSFHSTKLFHTIEGGACIVKDKAVSDELEVMKRFGHDGDRHICMGINAKQSEFHAAMGLALLPHLPEIYAGRRRVSEQYDALLEGYVERPKTVADLEYNYAYYPVVFRSELELKHVLWAVNKKQIFPRRYFYPSLNKLPYLKQQIACPISEDIAGRIACLPLYPELSEEIVDEISSTIRKVLQGEAGGTKC